MVTPNMETIIHPATNLGVANIKVGHKATTFLLPVMKGGGWSDDQEWPPDVEGLSKMCQ